MAGIGVNDRKLGAQIRRLTLRKIEKILADDYPDEAFQKAVILKLASTVLPRINEHSGEDGESIKVTVEIAGEIAKKHDSTRNPEGDSEGQPQV